MDDVDETMASVLRQIQHHSRCIHTCQKLQDLSVVTMPRQERNGKASIDYKDTLTFKTSIQAENEKHLNAICVLLGLIDHDKQQMEQNKQ